MGDAGLHSGFAARASRGLVYGFLDEENYFGESPATRRRKGPNLALEKKLTHGRRVLNPKSGTGSLVPLLFAANGEHLDAVHL